VGQALLQAAEEAGQVLHLEITEEIGEDPGDDEPVFQGVAGAGRGLGAVGDGPPAAVRRAGQVHGEEVQVGVAGLAHVAAGPQVVAVAIHQGRRQEA